MPAHAQRINNLLALDKECAYCRRHTMGSEVQAGRPEAAGDRSARGVQGRFDCRLGAGYGKERTRNMLLTSMTLDVSKLSGWSNANAK